MTIDQDTDLHWFGSQDPDPHCGKKLVFYTEFSGNMRHKWGWVSKIAISYMISMLILIVKIKTSDMDKNCFQLESGTLFQ
jgi:hypothetical protein